MQHSGSYATLSPASVKISGLPDLKVMIERNFAALESLRQTWDEAVNRLKGSIYMTYDWSRTWWDFYGGTKDLRIFLFYSGESIVGIVPLYIDRLGFGPLRLSVARLVGANIPPKVFDPPIHQDFAGMVLEKIVEHLFENESCDVLSLGPISEQYAPTAALEKAALARNGRVSQGVHTIFWLPDTMEQYFDSLSKNERKNRRKYQLRTLKKEYDTKVEVLSEPEEVEQEFEAFVRQHTAHWNAQGRPGHFKAWPQATEYNRALVKALGGLGRTRFVKISADGQVIANQYAFAFGDSYVWELPARAVGEQWERFSLGPTGIVTMIEAAINEGKRRLEGGLAHYEYKLRLNATEYATKTFRLVCNQAGSRLRYRFFAGLRSLLELGYHKLWYRRLRSHLPIIRYWPQWALWLRLDF